MSLRRFFSGGRRVTDPAERPLHPGIEARKRAEVSGRFYVDPESLSTLQSAIRAFATQVNVSCGVASDETVTRPFVVFYASGEEEAVRLFQDGLHLLTAAGVIGGTAIHEAVAA